MESINEPLNSGLLYMLYDEVVFTGNGLAICTRPSEHTRFNNIDILDGNDILYKYTNKIFILEDKLIVIYDTRYTSYVEDVIHIQSKVSVLTKLKSDSSIVKLRTINSKAGLVFANATLIDSRLKCVIFNDNLDIINSDYYKITNISSDDKYYYFKAHGEVRGMFDPTGARNVIMEKHTGKVMKDNGKNILKTIKTMLFTVIGINKE